MGDIYLLQDGALSDTVGSHTYEDMPHTPVDVDVARLQTEAQERAQAWRDEPEFKMQTEADKAVRMGQLELEAQACVSPISGGMTTHLPPLYPSLLSILVDMCH